MTPSTSPARATDVRHEPRPGVALVGCGAWGRNLARALHDLGALVAVSDLDGAAAEQIAKRYGVRASDLGEILADGDIQGVVIAAPAGEHAKLAREALGAGKHAFVEKPLALDVTEGEHLCRLAEASERVLMVGHLLRYHPAFRALEEMVRGGELGRIEYLYSNR